MHSFNYQKYNSRNPLKRYLINHFLKSLLKLADLNGSEKICDLGCGEGIVASFLSRKYPDLIIEGRDINPLAIKLARQNAPHLKFAEQDINECDRLLKDTAYDYILVLEVMEHLRNCREILEKLSACNFKAMIITIPHEPWFRLVKLIFLKDILRAGRSREHLHCWNEKKFSALLKEHLSVAAVSKPFPWLMFKCEKKHTLLERGEQA